MIRSPELATEVTMQPLARFPFDAAIIFSDILVVPEALGQPFSFREGRGVQMEFALRTEADLDRICDDGATHNLGYVYDAIARTRSTLGEDRALLGFCGSPWTLAAYMVEGGSSADGSIVRAMAARRDPALQKLLSMLTGTLVEYLRGQIAAGADAVQIFDSWAAWCDDYEEWSLRWVRELIAALPSGFPVIFFARGRTRQAAALASTGATVLTLDWETPLSEARRALGNEAPALQGNMDPSFLEGEPTAAAAAAREVLSDMASFRGHIFNLGHGIRPTARPECVEAVVETVLNFRSHGYVAAD
jgi:uroporphyrinogen decarboxylase